MQQFKRSRLERKSEDQVAKKTVALGLITILVFIFLVVFGLPLLIKFSIFLGETKNKTNANNEEKILPPPPPRIFLPYEATNSATVNIQGTGEPKLKVELLKDDVLLSSKDISENGSFEFDAVTLNEGKNVFVARVLAGKGVTSDFSKPLEVMLDRNPPELRMLNPSEDQITVDYSDFDVVGQSSEKGISATVNGRVALLESDGRFKLKLQLVPGKNEVEIIVTDLAGNQTKKKIVITYDI